MTTATWDRAARDAADEILELAEHDDIIAGSIWVELVQMDEFVHCASTPSYVWLGALALRWSKPWGTSLSEHLDAIVKVVISKQHDYGTDNIAKFGHTGLQVRLHDKVARLANLVSKGSAAKNESLEDTWRDIVGYSIVGLMWENETFWLPLASERAEQIEDAEREYALHGDPSGYNIEIVNAPLEQVVEAVKGAFEEALDEHLRTYHPEATQRAPRLALRMEKAYAADFAQVTLPATAREQFNSVPDIEGRDVVIRPATYSGYLDVENGGILLADGVVVER